MFMGIFLFLKLLIEKSYSEKEAIQRFEFTHELA
jgi:hypothetical protein